MTPPIASTIATAIPSAAAVAAVSSPVLTDASIVALLAAIPTTIAAIGALVVSVRNSGKFDQTNLNVEESRKEVMHEVRGIHVLSNSILLASMRAELASTFRELSLSRQIMAFMSGKGAAIDKTLIDAVAVAESRIEVLKKDIASRESETIVAKR